MQKKGENGDAVSKTEEEHPEREERMDAEFLLSLVSGNRFILTLFIQNIISINSSLNYVI